MLGTLIIALGILQGARGLRVTLHHRVLVPTSPASAQFVPKGSVELDYALDSQVYTTYTPSDSATRDLTSYINLVDDDSSALYQVALEVPDVPQDLWPFSSVGACHLPAANGERIRLHILPPTTPHPYALDYWLITTNAPDNGACPPRSSKSSSPASSNFDTTNWNTTIVTKAPKTLPVPLLRVPPPLTPEGKPMEVKPEPSFISKYWMYLVGAFVLLTFILPAPEEEGTKDSGGGGSKS